MYMHQTDWSDAAVLGENSDEIHIGNKDRAYLSTSPTPDPYAYFKPNLLGGYMQYEVDLSGIPCGCITAMYQVLMPAKQADGSLFDRAYWYCGAQQSKFNGMSCPEFDIMEANQWGFHTTAHPCDGPDEFGYYANDACDFQGQCVVDIEDVGATDRYGPGEQFDINTLLPYTVRIDYHDFEGHFVGYTTTLTQGDQTIELTGDCRDYLNRMTDNVIDGMAFVVSIWRPRSARWLQGDRCDEKCEWPVNTVFRDVEFWTYGGKQAKDVDIVYGGTCANLQDGLCDSSCSECRYSYPADEPDRWHSDWAKCRCKDDSDYSYGNVCEAEDDQSKCGRNCEFCNYSWPVDDPDKFRSSETACRCVPNQPKNIY